MDKSLPEFRANQILDGIVSTLREANKIIGGWDSSRRDADDEANIAYFIESAFIQTLVFLEAVGLNETLHAVRDLSLEATKNYSAIIASQETGDLYLVWSLRIAQYVTALRQTFGEPDVGTVTKPVVERVRATQYAITDQECFSELPKDEAEVHSRIEAVLRCVFPDLIRKPAIAKQLKNFVPDTGLPSQKTLIEYKFISSKKQAKIVADQILADIGGYVSDDWKHTLYVVYETKRIHAERQWTEHLQKCGAGKNISIVVLCGEVPRKRQKMKK